MQISRTVQCYPAGWRCCPAAWRWRGVMSSVTSTFPLHTLLKVALCPWGHLEHQRLGGKRARRKTQSWPLHTGANPQVKATGLTLLKAAAESTRVHGSLCRVRVQPRPPQNRPCSLWSCWAATGDSVDSGDGAGGRCSWVGICLCAQCPALQFSVQSLAKWKECAVLFLAYK